MNANRFRSELYFRLAAAVGKDWKGKMSAVLYAVAIPLAFVHQLIADAIYVFVAGMWLVPDPRIESHLSKPSANLAS